MFSSTLALATSLMFDVSFGGYVNNNTQTDCTESITVTDVDFRQVSCSTFNFPCDDLEGKYYFTGLDSQGTPTYKQFSTGAFFSVKIDQINPQVGVMASLAFTYDGNFFAAGWNHNADVLFIDDNCNNNFDKWEVQDGALLGANNVIYYPQGASYPPLYIIATLDDCLNIGLDSKFVTQSPTSFPTLPTPSPSLMPTNTNECPTYNYTEYSSCSNDTNCFDCQPWGCASCKNGYYKMGNHMRCQNCVLNYPGCQIDGCNDWNGCTTCEIGKLEYSAACDDEVCQ